jgi:hypothetical protein
LHGNEQDDDRQHGEDDCFAHVLSPISKARPADPLKAGPQIPQIPQIQRSDPGDVDDSFGKRLRSFLR